MSNVCLLCGDAVTMLRTLDAESVQCCVTSPPYYGMRDYGTGRWVDGNDPDCDHLEGRQTNRTASAKQASDAASNIARRPICGKCGAIKMDDQIGLETSPAAYVERMVEVFAEVHRVLRADGTLWLNIGDSYAATGKSGGGQQGKRWANAGAKAVGPRGGAWSPAPDGYKPKDLLGIPWRLAFALQDWGWYLRQEIIWHKGNPMPESVRDRCTKAHETVFMLTKSPRYYFNAEAIAEPAAGTGGGASFGKQKIDASGTRGQSRTYERPAYATRNARSVWKINTRSYHGAHFAVMPEALALRCILASSLAGDTVLDPFAGSGTTLSVAVREFRRAVGIELNPAYLPLIDERLNGGPVPKSTASASGKSARAVEVLLVNDENHYKELT